MCPVQGLQGGKGQVQELHKVGDVRHTIQLITCVVQWSYHAKDKRVLGGKTDYTS